MELYAGIDLHSNNSVVVVLDANDREVYRKRLPNDLGMIVEALRSCGPINAVAVESTFNWYWLVDGLQDAGYATRLVNTAAVKQYDGLKHSGDFSDARQLAHLLRLGILPTGYIYPRNARAVRDLLRKRSQLVRQRTTQILSMQNLLARNLGVQASGNEIKRWQTANIEALALLPEQQLALQSNLAVMQCLDEQIGTLEGAILKQARLLPEFHALRTVSGIGEVLALTIALETGDISRFETPGDFASYARTVNSRHESNGKKKGEGNTKCGNKHLAWAFVEAAHFAVRYDAQIKRWYQKKASKTLPVVAIKAVAHKLARACYHVMKTGEPFETARAFS
ncbi:MAG: IS110 family transposase [Thiobacillus sp.]|nr:IS110 family transposase [Thiobacillus sp.]